MATVLRALSTLRDWSEKDKVPSLPAYPIRLTNLPDEGARNRILSISIEKDGI